MTSAFGGQRSIQLSYGCLGHAARRDTACGAALSKCGGAALHNLCLAGSSLRGLPGVARDKRGSGLTNRQDRSLKPCVMATLPPEPTLSDASAVRQGATTVDAIAQAWTDLHGKAQALAQMARIAAEPDETQSALAPLLTSAQAWQRSLALQGLEDVGVMLNSGLTALDTLSGRGQDTAAPALALWREVHSARAAVLAVLQAGKAA